MRRAKNKKLIAKVPLIEKFSEKDNVRQGFFMYEDFVRLVSFLPEDLQDFVRFGYYTGWRHGQIAQLQWSEVEPEVIRLGPEKVKNKSGLILPLVGELMEIMARRRAVQRPEVPWVFYRARYGRLGPVVRFDKAWKTAFGPDAGLVTAQAQCRHKYNNGLEILSLTR
jgi:integrase